jgi:hypothetical protein
MKKFWRIQKLRLMKQFGGMQKSWPHHVLPFVNDELPDFGPVNTFIETGTLRGETTIHESRYFDRVHTIELSEELYKANLARFAAYPNINSHLGNSADVLPEVLKGVNEPCLLYLDAHWSGDSSVDWSTTQWKGYGFDTAHLGDGDIPTPEEQCPLLDELAVISRAINAPCIVLVDDIRVVGKKDLGFPGEDWTHISLENIYAACGADKIMADFQIHLPGQNLQYVIALRN